MRVLCDFDGTISRVDATDAVLDRFALRGWKEIEAAWEAGRIGSSACMQAQVRLIDASPQDLNLVLDQIELDPGFADLVAWCATRAIPISIVSDGIDTFIRRILKQHGFDNLPITANRLKQIDSRSWRLETEPGAACLVGSGVCKCQAVARLQDRRVVFIGDGRSDFCVAKSAQTIFAKDKLMEWCRERDIAFHPYRTLSDVPTALERLEPAITTAQPQQRAL